MTKETTLRLIYIHGFQGDHTSFQAFPTDLHERLRARIPTDIVLESCLYPTYKSRRPIAEASKNFIDWLSTQPQGPIILLAHSMGGLLAADVATGDSEQSKRVIGLLAFDVPFLGMHPHVIISGISSLFPKDKEEKTKTEKELNDGNIVKQVHSDDVESARGNSLDARPHASSSSLPNLGDALDDKQEHCISPSESPSPNTIRSQPSRPPLSHSSSPSGSQLSDEWEAMKTTLRPPSARSSSSSPSNSSSTSLRASAQSFASSFATTSSTYIISRIPPLSSPLNAKLERAADRIAQHADSPLVRWLRKHADDPLSAMSKWVVEHFEFGICMFDPAGLSERYLALERWNGNWVNFWTETPALGIDPKATAEPEEQEGEEGDEAKDINGALPGNTADLARFADVDEQSSSADARSQAKARKTAEKTLRKERAKERKRGEASVRPARHFIVLPHARNAHSDALHFGSRERWERVPIRGVEDEVGAHCGLFIRAQNPDYEALVERVAGVVEGWCTGLKI